MKKKLKCLALALALVLFTTSIPTSLQALAEEEASALDYVYNSVADFDTDGLITVEDTDVLRRYLVGWWN